MSNVTIRLALARIGVIVVLIACASDTGGASKEGVGRSAQVAKADTTPLPRDVASDSAIQEWSVSQQPSMEIGAAAEQPKALIARPVRARLSRGGGAVILDAGDLTVKYFDSLGKFVVALGGSGQGPGEFTYVTDMVLVGDDTAVVLDGQRNVVSVMHPAVGLIRSTPVPSDKLRAALPADFRVTNRYLLDERRVIVRATHGLPDTTARIVRDSVSFLLYDIEAERALPVLDNFGLTRVRLGAGSSSMDVVPMYPASDMLVARTRLGRLCVANHHSTSIECSDTSGKRDTRLLLRDTTVPVTDEEVQRWRRGNATTIERVEKAGMSGAVTAKLIPAHRPALGPFLLDPLGMLWFTGAFAYGTFSDTIRFQILDLSGRRCATIRVPGRSVADLSEDKILVHNLGPDNVQTFRVYAYKRTTGC